MDEIISVSSDSSDRHSPFPDFDVDSEFQCQSSLPKEVIHEVSSSEDSENSDSDLPKETIENVHEEFSNQVDSDLSKKSTFQPTPVFDVNSELQCESLSKKVIHEVSSSEDSDSDLPKETTGNVHEEFPNQVDTGLSKKSTFQPIPVFDVNSELQCKSLSKKVIHEVSSSEDSDSDLPKETIGNVNEEFSNQGEGLGEKSTFNTFDGRPHDIKHTKAKKAKVIKNATSKIDREEKLKKMRQKKLEQAQEKALKKAAQEAQKMKRPGECLKYITVLLDQRLLTKEYSGELLLSLKNAEIQYEIQDNLNENTITWVRTVNEYGCDDDLKITVSSSLKHEDVVLTVVMCNDIIKLIQTNMLRIHVQNIMSVHTSKKLTLIIYGLEQYFRLQSLEKKRKFKARVQTQTSPSGISNSYSVSRNEVEKAFIELQIFENCSYRLVESSQDLGSLIVQFTKALAEKTFKLEKQQRGQEKLEWFAAGDSRDTVKVDKSGHGLLRLWKQQLCQFGSVSLDTAEAIVSVYPSPKSLVQAYEKCVTQKEGESLLQDIPVRRGAGVLASVKRIGPELSKKIYTFFTALYGDLLLSQN